MDLFEKYNIGCIFSIFNQYSIIVRIKLIEYWLSFKKSDNQRKYSWLRNYFWRILFTSSSNWFKIEKRDDNHKENLNPTITKHEFCEFSNCAHVRHFYIEPRMSPMYRNVLQSSYYRIIRVTRIPSTVFTRVTPRTNVHNITWRIRVRCRRPSFWKFLCVPFW